MSRVRSASKAFRLHVGIFGRRNAGKSSLLNALARQDVAIVSAEPGTTTDPVEKAMELQPIGPVLLIDTAGLDDEGSLGEQRVARSRRVLERTDLGLLVAAGSTWGEPEETLLAELAARGVPAAVAFNRADEAAPAAATLARLAAAGIPWVATTATTSAGLEALRALIILQTPAEFLEEPALVSDLVGPGELALLVVPIDKEAPKGRLIMPQVQAIRDLLDGDALCLVVKERELAEALALLKKPPRLVVTDSQAFLKVAADVPPAIPLTSFSILLARYRGDLLAQTEGALAIARLRPDDRVLIAEACSHHPVGEDIGRVKIPRWLTQVVGGALRIDTVQGLDFPEDLGDYQLVIHCGACTITRRTVLGRLSRCREAGVPMTNYGLAIAASLGILERALSPFPAAQAVLARSRPPQHSR